MRKDMKASDYRQHARYCRDLAKHTLPGEFREQLLEIAKTWDTLAVEEREWVQQHLELALGEHQDEDALTGRGPFSSRRGTRSPLVRRETSKHSSPRPTT
jgi:hypothetical protein